jgi:hypothetical protein
LNRPAASGTLCFMKVRYALLILIAAALAAYLLFPHGDAAKRVRPVARFVPAGPVGEWDSVAVTDTELWITDKDEGQIVVCDRTANREKRRLGPAIGLKAPNGIAAFRRQDTEGAGWLFLVADFGRGDVLVLDEGGDLVSRFAPGAFSRPQGVALAEIDTRLHVLIADQPGPGRGAVSHFVIEGEATSFAASAPVWTAAIAGEIESVALVGGWGLALVANESRRRIECLRLEDGTPAGTIGAGAFRGEPEGIAVRPGGNAIVAVDQTADARLLVFGRNGNLIGAFRSDPPLEGPDGVAARDGHLFVVTGDRALYAYPFTALAADEP